MGIDTHQFKPRTCPSCQQNNAAFALMCVHCGTALPAPNDNPVVMAEVLYARLKAIAQNVHKSYAEKLAAGSLVLYVPADDAAIILSRAEKMILGRAGANADTGYYDLTPYSAYTLGVSRRHASVSYYTAQGYAITDLGSANGTWVNSRRLAPNTPHYLVNTDQIWLGQLIVLGYLVAPDE